MELVANGFLTGVGIALAVLAIAAIIGLILLVVLFFSFLTSKKGNVEVPKGPKDGDDLV